MSLSDELRKIESEAAEQRSGRLALFHEVAENFCRHFPELATTRGEIEADQKGRPKREALLFTVESVQFALALVTDERTRQAELLTNTRIGWWPSIASVTPTSTKREFAEMIYRSLQRERQRS